MKEISIDKKDYRYAFIQIEPGDIEGCNIGGILAIPQNGIKTNKLLTMFQTEKYQDTPEDQNSIEPLTKIGFDRSVDRIMREGPDVFDAMGLDGQVVLLPLLPSAKRVEMVMRNNGAIAGALQNLGAELLVKECFTEIPETSEFFRLDKQVATMIKEIQGKYNLDSRTNFFGHSTTGLSAMRFSMLHPQLIDNLIIGGNADEVPTPFEENGTKLKFPFGIQDFEELFGEKFDLEAFTQIHFRHYIGEYEYVDPNLDGIRDENYGIKRNGQEGSGRNFAPKQEADEYKDIYNAEYRSDDNLSVYERLANVLRAYEAAGLDMKYKIYPEDCHSMIQSTDLDDAQFANGEHFIESGSQTIIQLLEQTKEFEEFAKRALTSNDIETRTAAEQYAAISRKIQYNKEASDAMKRVQALKSLNRLRARENSNTSMQVLAENALAKQEITVTEIEAVDNTKKDMQPNQNVNEGVNLDEQ